MIPDAAAVAALNAFYARDADGLEATDDAVLAALNAAAPHMGAASVWHDAVSAAYIDGALSADQASAMYNANPYRPNNMHDDAQGEK